MDSANANLGHATSKEFSATLTWLVAGYATSYDDILVPNTGRSTLIIVTASGCTMCVAIIISASTICFLRRRK